MSLFAFLQFRVHWRLTCEDSPARHVTSQCGQQIQKKFFDELLSTLEEIQPGISANI